VLDLKQLAGARYKIVLDPSSQVDTDRETRLWCYRIPGKAAGKPPDQKTSFISVHGPETLAAWSDRPRIVRRLAALPFAHTHQRGDREIRVLFPVDRLDEVCAVIQAKRRRQVSEAERLRLAEMGRRHSPWRLQSESKSDPNCDAG
jgi:hypothetical protein